MPTALVLVLIVGVWAITAGLVEFSAAFASGEPANTLGRAHPGGLVTIAFGVVLCARPGIGAITLALLFGLFNLIAGTWNCSRAGHRAAPHREDPAPGTFPPHGKEPGLSRAKPLAGLVQRH